MNRHEKLPLEEQIKEHNYDYNHKLIDLGNQMYELGQANECHPDEVVRALNYVYQCLESLKHTQEAIVKIVKQEQKQETT